MSIQSRAPHERCGDSARRWSMLGLVLNAQIAWAAAKVALLVGTVLNIVNSGEQLWQDHTVNLWQALLNYIVPFCVSSYSAARNEARRSNERPTG